MHETTLITLFLCGDVMTGRGIDQILPRPSDPRLFERYVKDARGYIALAERQNGPVPRPVDFAYIWGDALDEFARMAPDLRLINLETSITTSDDHWMGKGIHYRMNPANIGCITAAGIDCCALANNHVLDWGYAGLVETLEALAKVNVQAAGAGRDKNEAEAPVVLEIAEKGRVIVFAFGSGSSGIPSPWAALENRPGVNLLRDFSEEMVSRIQQQVRDVKQPGDIVVVSIHWGGNWGYEIPQAHVDFAHRLIDDASVDIIHGHSSHHPLGIEVYHGKPIIYGCGDFLDDYEGITGYEAFRDDLGYMYFVRMEPTSGKLVSFQLTPTEIRHFKVNRASLADTLWLRDVMERESQRFGTRAVLNADNTLTLLWD